MRLLFIAAVACIAVLDPLGIIAGFVVLVGVVALAALGDYLQNG
jgi:hypothetical protein